MMEGIDDILAKPVDLGFLAADAGVMNAFFCFNEVALTDMIHYGLMEMLIFKSFESRTWSEVLVNKLAQEVCKRPNLREQVLKVTNFNESEENLVKHEIMETL